MASSRYEMTVKILRFEIDFNDEHTSLKWVESNNINIRCPLPFAQLNEEYFQPRMKLSVKSVCAKKVGSKKGDFSLLKWKAIFGNGFKRLRIGAQNFNECNGQRTNDI